MKRSACLLILSAFLVLGAPAPVGAETPWSEPELVSSEENQSWFPEIDADPSGAVRIIWEAESEMDGVTLTDLNATSFVVREHDTGGWNEPGTVYVKDIYNAGRPIIVSDGTYMHLLGRALRGGGVTARSVMNIAGLYYMRAPLSSDLSNVHSWSTPVPISTQSAYWASITTLPDGGLVVVYNERATIWVNGEAQDRPTLYSRRSTDYGATWQNPVRISYTGQPVARSSIAATDDGDTIIVSWDEGDGTQTGIYEFGGVYTAVSTDGGASWDHRAMVGENDPRDTPGSVLRQPRLSHALQGWAEQGVVQTTDQTTLLVYRSIGADLLLYRVSDDLGRTWSDEQVVPGAVPRPYGGRHHFDKLGLAVDGDGRFLLSYIGTDPDAPRKLSVMMTTFLDGEWTAPDVLASPDGFPEYPRVAVALGNQVHVVYFVRDDMFDEESPMTVWTVQRESDARAIDAIPTVTVASNPRATPQAVRPSPAGGSLDVVAYPQAPSPAELEENSSRSSVAPVSAFQEPVNAALALTIAVMLLCACVLLLARSSRFFRI